MQNPIYFKVLVACGVIAALLSIVQIWVMILPWDVFVKILITLAIVFVLVGFLMVMVNDFGNKKKLKEDNYID